MNTNESLKRSIDSDLKTQWEDHFHMRDQTWKLLQYSILLFLGVVGLEIKVPDRLLLIIADSAVILTSLFGFLIALHHRTRQKEKFQIFVAYEKELGLYNIIKPFLSKSKFGLNTIVYICVMQFCLFAISVAMILRHVFP